MTILPYLSFPKTTIVKLGYFPHESDEPASLVLHDCASLREIASDVKMVTLELWHDSSYNIFGALRSPQLEIEVLANSYTDLEECEFTGFSVIPFPALSHLTVRDMGCPFFEDQWRRMFQRIPTITHLEVCAKDAMTLVALRVLRIGVPDAETVLCPELIHLVLSGGVDEGQVICEELLSCCLARAAAGAPISSCKIVLAAQEEISTPVLARLNDAGVHIIVHPTNS